MEHEKPIARELKRGWWIVESTIYIARWESENDEDRHIVYFKNSVSIKLSGKSNKAWTHLRMRDILMNIWPREKETDREKEGGGDSNIITNQTD